MTITRHEVGASFMRAHPDVALEHDESAVCPLCRGWMADDAADWLLVLILVFAAGFAIGVIAGLLP